jgi:hypothetical protein
MNFDCCILLYNYHLKQDIGHPVTPESFISVNPCPFPYTKEAITFLHLLLQISFIYGCISHKWNHHLCLLMIMSVRLTIMQVSFVHYILYWVYLNTQQFIPSATYGYLNCFSFFIFYELVAMDIHLLDFCGYIFSFLLCKSLRYGISSS